MAKTPKAITLRNLPEPVARAVRERAAKYHVSLNKAVIGLLEEAAVGGAGKKPPRVRRDLDELFGTWSEEDAHAIDEALAWTRRIDPEMWR